MYQRSFTSDGFEWLEVGDAINSVLVYIRKGNDPKDELVIALNMTPVPRNNYRIGLPAEGTWEIVLNSDETIYFGSGILKQQKYISEQIRWENKEHSTLISLPPLGGFVLKRTT